MSYDDEEELLKRIQEKLDALDTVFAENQRRIEKMKATLGKLEMEILMDEIYDYLEG
jgi:oligoribonuclease NrnB/cAMP/cGMP phosphodiesterase (DHH superfamily)